MTNAMPQIAIVGCGVVGAAIAYELSQVPNIGVTVLDRQPPAQAATGAALGVLMGAISQKTKGNNLRMRLAGIQRYNEWIPQLEAATGRSIPFNRQGILRLCFAGEDLAFWTSLAEIRQAQGWRLQIYDRDRLSAEAPQLNLDRVIGAVYSPDDRQVDPTALTLALVEASQRNGVQFRFDAPVTAIECAEHESKPRCHTVCAGGDRLPIDWLVIAAGLGSTPLTAALQQPVDVRPVLGQAVRMQLPEPLGNSVWQPVITGEDTHLVPLGADAYWIGATVEFPQAAGPHADPAMLEQVMQRAIALCPALANGTIVHQWSGLRPRPEGRPAPIIEWLPGYQNVVLATGHYRNGVLLAPATAERVRQMLLKICD